MKPDHRIGPVIDVPAHCQLYVFQGTDAMQTYQLSCTFIDIANHTYSATSKVESMALVSVIMTYLRSILSVQKARWIENLRVIICVRIV